MNKRIEKLIEEKEMNELARLEYSLKAAETIMNSLQNSKPVNKELFNEYSKQYTDLYAHYNIFFNKLAYKYFKKEMEEYPTHSMLFNISELLFIMVI